MEQAIRIYPKARAENRREFEPTEDDCCIRTVLKV